MNKAEVLAIAQRDHLVAQWDQDPRFGDSVDSFIAFPHISDLQKRAQRQKACVSKLIVHGGNAYVYKSKSGEKELWVRAFDKSTGTNKFNYARSWNLFERLCGVPKSDVLNSNWQVDHVYPETSAARRGFHLVRAMPVPKKGNAGVGASFEAKLANIKPFDHLGGWTANWYTIAKVTGYNGTFNMKLINDSDLADNLIEHLLTAYPNLKSWEQATVDDERKRLTEFIASVRGRIINVDGVNERLKEEFRPAWSLGFADGHSGRSNRVPAAFVGDERRAWTVGWAVGKAMLDDTSG